MSFWDQLTDSLEEFGASIGNWVPKIVGALIILLVGWFIARIIRRVVRKLLDRPAVNSALDKAGIGPALRDAGYSAASLLATIVYAILMLIVLIMAAEALQVQAIVDLLEKLVAYLPLVIVAIIILVVTAAIGAFAGDMVRPMGESRGMPWMGNAVRFVIVGFGVITALDVLGVGRVTNRILDALLATAGLTIAATLAIAFGVGGIDTAKRWWHKLASPKSEAGGV